MIQALRPRSLRALLVPLALASSASAGVRYVDASLSSGANDGSSWANAYQGVGGVQTALTAAVAGDQVWVRAGTYEPTASTTRTISLVLKTGVEVYGGFAGGETTLSQRDPVANVTTLTGDLNGDDGSSLFNDNSFHVLNGAGANSTAVIDGFTVRGGNANGGGANQDRGGGILCLGGASPSVRSCTFTANRCSFGGGAGYLNGSSPAFTHCVFDGNFGASFGGAFDMASGVGATFDRCVFRNNSAARAGAIEIFGSSPVRVWNSLFHGNVATGAGGGAMFVSGSSPQIRNCTIVGNSATANVAGGILATGSAPTIVNCVVDGNTGQGGSSGAASQISPSNLNVTYSLVPAGYAGTGNLNGAPIYDACGPQPFRLSPASPGIDAGNNAGVVAAMTADLAGGPRFADVPAVPNSGAGSAPIVDMGALESGDCNGNGLADWCDIANATSSDANGNGLPDECECQGGATPVVYCTAKLNSQFCLPAIGFQGFPSVSGASTFLITATNLLNQKSGLLFYGYLPQAVPFQGGTMCVRQPIRRTSLLNSGGSPTGLDCTGTFSFDFNAHFASGLDPLIQVVGQQVNAQFWSRDPQDPFTTNTTDAVQFAVCQ
jgi:hypothetical protein